MADSGTIEIKGLDERIKQLGQLSTKNPMMRRRINEVIKRTLQRVRKSLQGEAKSGLGMTIDPRNAYKAVRMAVYRRLFGGQVNILQSRRAGELRYYEPPRRGTSDRFGRGGNRVKQQERTTKLMSYTGADRGFILRFLNAGTDERHVRSMGGHSLRSGNGNRGAISPRNWFGPRSQAELESAAQEIDKMIDDIVAGIMY